MPLPEPILIINCAIIQQRKMYIKNGTVLSRTLFLKWLWKYHLSMATILFRVNILRPRQNGCHFADDTFKRIFLNENVIISIQISLKFVPKGPINNIPALVQITAWRRAGDKSLSEAMMVSLLTHICITRPQWVKGLLNQSVILLTHLPLVPYMRQWTGSALLQVMACRLFGAKPLPEPILNYCQLDT